MPPATADRFRRTTLAMLPTALTVIAALAVASCSRSADTSKQSSGRKMNVLLIIADDYNTTMGVYGNMLAETPNLDRLSQRGVRFESAYCQYPLGNPSRASFLGGLRPESTGILDDTTSPREKMPSAVFLPQLFRQQGYFTAGVGKVFNAGRFLVDGKNEADFVDSSSFDVSVNELELLTNPEMKRAAETRPSEPGRLEWHADEVADEETGDGIVARRTAELLEQHAKDGQPFFIAAGFRKPGLPWNAPKKYFDLYRTGEMPLASASATDLDDIPPIALTQPVKVSDREKRELVHGYYACTSFMDAQVGVVLEALDRLNLWDNTIVVFISDSGYQLGEHLGLWQDGTLFEKATRTPMIVVVPGKPGRAKTSGLVELVDIYPTLAELCGLPLPENLEGTSFVPLLDKPARSWKTAVFTSVNHQGTLGRSVRTERNRYTEWGDENTAELYDLQQDPQELKNLVNDPQQAQTLADMRKLLKDGWSAVTPSARATSKAK